MKNRRLVYTAPAGTTDINVSPLIDIVFILLIFFIVTTVFVQETGVEVERPQATASRDLAKEAIYLAVTADGSVIYAGASIGINGVRGVLGRLLTRDPDLPVIIQADRSVALEQYVKVHDAALAAGATRIQLATRQEGP